MITFNNFQFKENSRVLDITIPPSSVVYIKNCYTDIFTQKPFLGEILFQNFPIQHAMGSFSTNIFYHFSPEILFEKMTLEKNMKKFGAIFGREIIWNVPLSYFEIEEKMWNEKIKNVDVQTRLCLCYGAILLFHGTVLLVNVNKEISTKNAEKLAGLLASRAHFGKDIIFYYGKNLEIEKEIVINL